MRREGYEFQVSKPEVIFRQENGQTLEPVEEVYIEVPGDSLGVVMEMLGSRRSTLKEMHTADDGSVHLQYLVPTRGLLGFRNKFLTSTRGTGIMHALFHGYLPLAGEIDTREHGSLVAFEAGTTTAFALENAEGRGTLFVGPGVEVYEGMVIGEQAREGDIAINVAKKKHLTNIRSSNSDFTIQLTPPRLMSLDEALEYISEDELLEITPKAYRIRKRILGTEDRHKAKSARAKAAEALAGA
jgi:GTP-binding protein